MTPRQSYPYAAPPLDSDNVTVEQRKKVTAVTFFRCPTVNVVVTRDQRQPFRPVAQIPQRTSHISHKMHQFVTEMYTSVHISVINYCIVRYLPEALWDLWDGSQTAQFTMRSSMSLKSKLKVLALASHRESAVGNNTGNGNVRFSSQKASDMNLILLMLPIFFTWISYWISIESPVIWKAVTVMRRHCKVFFLSGGQLTDIFVKTTGILPY